jgi:hypothetical protein
MKMIARVNSKYRFRNSGGSAQSVYGYVLDGFCECDRIRPKQKYRPGEGLRVQVLFVQYSRRIDTDGSLFTRRLNGVLHVDGLAEQEAGEVLLLRNYKQGRNPKCFEEMAAMPYGRATNCLESLAEFSHGSVNKGCCLYGTSLRSGAR